MNSILVASNNLNLAYASSDVCRRTRAKTYVYNNDRILAISNSPEAGDSVPVEESSQSSESSNGSDSAYTNEVSQSSQSASQNSSKDSSQDSSQDSSKDSSQNSFVEGSPESPPQLYSDSYEDRVRGYEIESLYPVEADEWREASGPVYQPAYAPDPYEGEAPPLAANLLTDPRLIAGLRRVFDDINARLNPKGIFLH